MRKQLRAKGVMLTLAVALAVGAPVSVLQNPVEASAKAVAKRVLRKKTESSTFTKKAKRLKISG